MTLYKSSSTWYTTGATLYAMVPVLTWHLAGGTFNALSGAVGGMAQGAGGGGGSVSDVVPTNGKAQYGTSNVTTNKDGTPIVTSSNLDSAASPKVTLKSDVNNQAEASAQQTVENTQAQIHNLSASTGTDYSSTETYEQNANALETKGAKVISTQSAKSDHGVLKRSEMGLSNVQQKSVQKAINMGIGATGDLGAKKINQAMKGVKKNPMKAGDPGYKAQLKRETSELFSSGQLSDKSKGGKGSILAAKWGYKAGKLTSPAGWGLLVGEAIMSLKPSGSLTGSLMDSNSESMSSGIAAADFNTIVAGDGTNVNYEEGDTASSGESGSEKGAVSKSRKYLQGLSKSHQLNNKLQRAKSIKEQTSDGHSLAVSATTDVIAQSVMGRSNELKNNLKSATDALGGPEEGGNAERLMGLLAGGDRNSKIQATDWIDKNIPGLLKSSKDEDKAMVKTIAGVYGRSVGAYYSSGGSSVGSFASGITDTDNRDELGLNPDVDTSKAAKSAVKQDRTEADVAEALGTKQDHDQNGETHPEQTFRTASEETSEQSASDTKKSAQKAIGAFGKVKKSGDDKVKKAKKDNASVIPTKLKEALSKTKNGTDGNDIMDAINNVNRSSLNRNDLAVFNSTLADVLNYSMSSDKKSKGNDLIQSPEGRADVFDSISTAMDSANSDQLKELGITENIQSLMNDTTTLGQAGNLEDDLSEYSGRFINEDRQFNSTQFDTTLRNTTGKSASEIAKVSGNNEEQNAKAEKMYTGIENSNVDSQSDGVDAGRMFRNSLSSAGDTAKSAMVSALNSLDNTSRRTSAFVDGFMGGLSGNYNSNEALDMNKPASRDYNEGLYRKDENGKFHMTDPK